MTLKTKISAAAEHYVDEVCIGVGTKAEPFDEQHNLGSFIAGAEFTLGEVRELLTEARDALQKITLEVCMAEWAPASKPVNWDRCEAALKKIDDSGVLEKE
jgi:hypothetical protein